MGTRDGVPDASSPHMDSIPYTGARDGVPDCILVQMYFR